MHIRIYIAVSDPIPQPKASLVFEFSTFLNAYFQGREYGEDVKKIEIGLLMNYIRKGYEDWYKPKRMTYTRYKKTKHKLTGEIIEIEQTLKYEIKLSDLQLTNYVGGDDILSRSILINEVQSSLSNLDKLPRDVKDFQVEKFKADIIDFFKSMEQHSAL